MCWKELFVCWRESSVLEIEFCVGERVVCWRESSVLERE